MKFWRCYFGCLAAMFTGYIIRESMEYRYYSRELVKVADNFSHLISEQHAIDDLLTPDRKRKKRFLESWQVKSFNP